MALPGHVNRRNKFGLEAESTQFASVHETRICVPLHGGVSGLASILDGSQLRLTKLKTYKAA